VRFTTGGRRPHLLGWGLDILAGGEKLVSNIGEKSPFNADIIQVSLGRFSVGVTSLKEAIEETRALQGLSEEEIAQTLADKIKAHNYIPASAEEAYKKALLREFKKTLGEQVEEASGGVAIRFLSANCPCSGDFLEVIFTVLSELGLPADVRHLTEAGEIAAYRVSGTPALIINGEVKAVGRMPSREVLKEWLRKIT
jgi:hypothetical protein